MRKIWGELLLSSFLVGFVAVSLVLMGDGFIGNAEGAGTKELVVQTPGGLHGETHRRAFFEPFTKETGIKIVETVTGPGELWGKVAAQVKSGNIEWDVVGGHDYSGVLMAVKGGLLEEIDYSVIPMAKELIPAAVKKWGLGKEVNVICVGYNTNKFPGDNHPKSWVDFFDVKKFPGPRTMNNFGGHLYNILAALLADGVPPDKLIPIDFDRAFKKLDQIKPHVKLWFTSGDQLIQALLEEQVHVGAVFDGRAKVAKSMGAPIAFGWDKGIFLLTYWNVVKGAPHKDAAMQFLNFVCRPELQAIWTKHLGYSTPNPKSVNYLSATAQKDQAVYPDNFKQEIEILTDKTIPWLGEHNSEITERWNAWLSK